MKKSITITLELPDKAEYMKKFTNLSIVVMKSRNKHPVAIVERNNFDRAIEGFSKVFKA